MPTDGSGPSALEVPLHGQVVAGALAPALFAGELGLAEAQQRRVVRGVSRPGVSSWVVAGPPTSPARRYLVPCLRHGTGPGSPTSGGRRPARPSMRTPRSWASSRRP